MKHGDLVICHDKTEHSIGLVLETGVNMWGEEVVPPGVRVLWCGGDIEVASEDELMTIEKIKEKGSTFK